MNKNASYLNKVIHGNCIDILKNIESKSVHLILSDIPYGIGAEDWDVLHSNTNSALMGSSPAQLKAGSVFKKRGKPLNGWSEADRQIPKEYYEWCTTWVGEWLRILKPGGSAIVFAGRRLAHRCVCAFEDTGFTYKDMLGWSKEKAAHRAQRLSIVFDKRGDKDSSEKWEGWKVGNLRPTFEPILWFTKPYKIGGTITDNVIENELGAYNEKAFVKYNTNPNNLINIESNGSDTGLHPTQKPLKLMQSLIELSTKENHIVLDPFCGSGTTLLAAVSLKRDFIGIEFDKNYYSTAIARIDKFKNEEL
jgi:site-specific DNA-methyltransferase (adenine-specific)